MGTRVAVAGASGYAGGELLRLIAGHPDLELAGLTADSNAGELASQLHPALAGVPALAGRRFEPAAAGRPPGGCDLVFAALPAGQSAALASQLPAGVKLVDLGPDHRLADPAQWARHYPGPHPGHWPCALPELPGARAVIAAADRVAVPGCYATAAILALAPLLAAGLIEAGDIVIAAASGTSGAGRALRPGLLGSEVMGSVSAYQPGGAHRHIPEIEQALAAAAPQAGPVRVSFTPMLAPMPRGILASCTARLAPAAAAQAGQAGDALRAALALAYPAGPFAWLLPPGQYPATGAVAGSNAAHLQAAADHRAGRATVIAAIDNLGKGAAGQAVQAANLMLGLAETAGLTAAGIAP
ncbi:MAG TPA: N-acetyl-gamma-glutamyl-phosphate reductase [Streptosporangiaceae bacterium]|jgi:N-acetyl-gamma-glutamyl-phosphate reductase